MLSAGGAVLYLAGELFACRTCYGLAYASEQGGLLFPNLRKSQAIWRRLGGSPGPCESFPERAPSGAGGGHRGDHIGARQALTLLA
jgi:hypothetical protein